MSIFFQSGPEENESQHDTSFRHITEITILTVQLIVEFAKGLPAFTKIPQEDQITLLKVSFFFSDLNNEGKSCGSKNSITLNILNIFKQI